MGDNMGLLLGSALGAFGATVVKGIASRKPNGMRSDSVRDFRTFEQDEAAKLNPSGIVEPSPEGVQGVHGDKYAVAKVDERDKGTPDEWVHRHPELIRLTGRHPFNCEPPLSLLYDAGFITPASIHYVRDHGAVPKCDEKVHRVALTGNVPKPTVYTLDQIKAMPKQTIPVTLVCAGNRRKEQNMVKQTIGFSWGAAGVSTSHWTGVPLYRILNAAGIFEPSEEAQYVCFRGPKGELPKGSDGTYGTSIPMYMALDPACDVMLAYEQNFEPLLPDHGFPIRVIIPGWIGGRMVKWLEEITVTKEPSDNYYHFNDNRILPPNVDAERATAEGWWYKPDYIFNELNINSATAYPAHEETLWVDEAAGASEEYTVRGYAYTGGGRKITRAEVSLDSGITWHLAEMDRPEKPTKYGKYWAWVFWSVKLDAKLIAGAQEICCRAWDAGNNTQPAYITWNVMGMGNSCFFRVRVHRMETEGSRVKLQFEHPTVAGPSPGGWMGNQAGGWKPAYKAVGAAKAGADEAFEKPAKADAPKPPSAKPRAPGSGGRKIPMSEVAQHNTEHDCWIVVDGKVFDTTKFNALHPGGGSSIFINAGTDTTEEFEAIHSLKAWGMLADWYIGDVADEPKANGHAANGNGNGVHAEEANGHLPGSAVLDPKKRIPFTLVKKTVLNHNTRIFRFAFPHKDQVLGLPVGMHVLMSSKVDGKLVMRAYTPISGDELPGFVDVLIKVYFKSAGFPAGGVLTQHLDSLKVGDTVDFKGPLGEIEYRGRGLFLIHGKERRVKEVAMVAGGSGITPMYQVVKNALEDPQDSTRFHLVFGNRNVEDILLRQELDALAKAHPARFRLRHQLSDAPKDTWDGPRGRISEKDFKDFFPAGTSAGGAVAFLCGPDGMQDAATKYLQAIGYAADSVFKF